MAEGGKITEYMSKQWDVRTFNSMLKKNGYTLVRQKGSHQIWKRGEKIISVPAVRLNCMMAQRLIKENELKEA